MLHTVTTGKKGSNFHIKLLGQASGLTVFEKIGEMVDIYFAQKKQLFWTFRLDNHH